MEHETQIEAKHLHESQQDGNADWQLQELAHFFSSEEKLIGGVYYDIFVHNYSMDTRFGEPDTHLLLVWGTLTRE